MSLKTPTNASSNSNRKTNYLSEHAHTDKEQQKWSVRVSKSRDRPSYSKYSCQKCCDYCVDTRASYHLCPIQQERSLGVPATLARCIHIHMQKTLSMLIAALGLVQVEVKQHQLILRKSLTFVDRREIRACNAWTKGFWII